MAEAATDRQRLDKWLWHVRLAPSRTRAAALVREGHVRLNGTRAVDPAKLLRPGDVLTLALANRTMVVRIARLLPRRVGAPDAATAYEDLSQL
jgi:ribosome-associated heat shock protein Hsp15